MTPAVTYTEWPRSVRVIPSRFPPIQLFEQVADPADLDAVIAIESLTNDRLRDEIGEIERVPPGERVTGAGAGYVMAPFTHVPPRGEGGRFNAGFGAYYAAGDRETAIAETVYHTERFLRDFAAPPAEIDRRVLVAQVRADFHDVRESGDAALYHPTDYTAGQALGASLREAGSWGIRYRSVRRADGECVAVFRPRAVTRCHQTAHLAYLWDGERIAHVVQKRLVR